MIAARSGTLRACCSSTAGKVSSGRRIDPSSTEGGQCFFQMGSMLVTSGRERRDSRMLGLHASASGGKGEGHAMRHKQVLLASRPKGQGQGSDFRLVETERAAPGGGQGLAR